MTSQLYDDRLFDLSPTEYLRKAVFVGRQSLDREMREKGSAIFRYAEAMARHESSMSKFERNLVHFLYDSMYSEDFLLNDPTPRYEAYTNMRVLNRYLLEGQGAGTQQRWDAARRALAIVIRDWHSLEQDRLANHAIGKLPAGVIGYEDPTANGDPAAHLKERERTLHALMNITSVSQIPETRIVMNDVRRCATEWEYFAQNRELQLSHFTCLPQTTWHDEIMFLKMIHATECCFAGILASLVSLPQLGLKGKWDTATGVLKSSLFFSDFLVKLWAVFDTMPVPHFFDGFREATGNASAIQSVRFQTLEVLSRGLGENKRGALQHQQESSRFARWCPPEEVTLPGLVYRAMSVGGDAKEFVAAAEMLDVDLLQWRARHYGIARKYLPKEAKGTGNEGTPYLAANFRDPLLAARNGGTLQMNLNADHNDRESGTPARASATLRVLQENAPPIAVVEGKNIRSSDLTDALAKIRDELLEQVEPRLNDIASNFAGYRTFFRPFAYPVEKQFKTFHSKGNLPKASIPAFLVSTEFRSGVLMGLHDATKIAGQIVFDTASQDESFSGIGGNLIQCSRDEPIVRDAKGIIASILQGPDARTAVHIEKVEVHQQWYIFVMGYPGMPMDRFRTAIMDAQQAMEAINASEIRTWIVHEY